MAKDNNAKKKKGANQQPGFHNDQLGENAAEHFSNRYDNKQNNKKKQG